MALLLKAYCPNRTGVYEIPYILIKQHFHYLDDHQIEIRLKELSDKGFLRIYPGQYEALIWVRDHFEDDAAQTTRQTNNLKSLYAELEKYPVPLIQDFIQNYPNNFNRDDLRQHFNTCDEARLIAEKPSNEAEYSKVIELLNSLLNKLHDVSHHVITPCNTSCITPCEHTMYLHGSVSVSVSASSSSSSGGIPKGGDSGTPKPEAKPKVKPEPKRLHGTFVRLTDIEYDKLIKDLGAEVVEKLIFDMNEYCGIHDRRYKNYNLAIRKWHRDNIEKGKPGNNGAKPKQSMVDKFADGGGFPGQSRGGGSR